jgi:sulfate transport system permease protein
MGDLQTREAAISEPAWVRAVLTAAGIAFLLLFLVVPLAAVFAEAFSRGWEAYLAALKDEETSYAMRLTLFIASVAVVANAIFGIAVAWAVTRFRFPGRTLLLTIVDLPLAVSPVIAGMLFVLLFGSHGVFHPIIERLGLKVIFAVPGMVLATTFVTVPFVARELIPLMEELGVGEEEAALSLGASGWQTFRLVTLPNIFWALLYGLVLCNARAMGEFGAVSVVSGHIRGETTTLPLHVEILYNEYHFAAAFAVASLLTLLALVTLLLRTVLEWRIHGGRAR